MKLFKQADTFVEKEWLKNHSIDGVLVDENGIATFVALENDKNADEYRDSFIKICKDIESSIIFAPAVHKGEKVKCHYIVLFSMYINTQY